MVTFADNKMNSLVRVCLNFMNAAKTINRVTEKKVCTIDKHRIVKI
jgi:hypothetical protein